MDFKGLSDPVVIHNEPGQKTGIFQKLRPPSTDFFKNKKFLGGALTVMLLFAVGIGVYLSQKPTQLTPQANLTTAEISIKPSSQTVGLNQQFQSDVFIDTRGLTVTVAQVKITFDPAKLELVAVTPGPFLPTPVASPVNTANSTSFVLFSNPGKQGAGNIATLTFKAIAETSGTPIKVEFDPNTTQAAAVESGSTNVASGYLSSEITISATGSPSPSDSVSPSTSPNASASPNNRVTPGAKGDGNSDGFIDAQDLSILFSNWSPAVDITTFLQLDFNDDKRINSIDRAHLTQLLVDLGVLHR
jgi:hypothetical protein